MLSLSSYHHFVLLIVTSLLLAGVIALASFTLQSATRTAEKVSTYECGFEPMSDARQEFDVKFFVVALLFIVFDLEIAYLFPWAVLPVPQALPYGAVLGFLLILAVGLVYEWVRGGLEWQ